VVNVYFFSSLLALAAGVSRQSQRMVSGSMLPPWMPVCLPFAKTALWS